jgi:threonine/homoserine/homoserine lactone efflux protein
MSLSNPQAFLWYMVFFAPFVEADQPLIPQLLVMIPTAVLIVFAGYAVYVMLGAPIRRFMTSKIRLVLVNRVSGVLLIVFAIVLGAATNQGQI